MVLKTATTKERENTKMTSDREHITQHPLTTAANALGELKHDAYAAACPYPSLTLCITAALEQISKMQTQLDAETLTANGLGEYLLTAREKLTALNPTILRGENEAYRAYFEINRLAEKIRVANLQREQNEGDNQ